MANDSVSVPDVLSQSPREADYQAVYAELVATERGRNFLAEHHSRHVHADTLKLVNTVVRLEAAVRDNSARQIPVTLFRDLADLARAIAQSQALAAINGSAANDLLAVERIQDIATALHRREVEPALCDALEAAAREVGDAIVRNTAASAGMLGAASPLSDLLVSINNLIALFDSVKSPSMELLAGKELRREEGALGQRAALDLVEPMLSVASEKTVDDETRSSAPTRRFYLSPGESAVNVAPGGSARPLLVSSPRAEPPPGSPLPDSEVKASLERASGPLLELPPQDPSQIAALERAVGTKAALPPDILRPVEPAKQGASQNDSLAEVLALSEEELIALFS